MSNSASLFTLTSSIEYDSMRHAYNVHFTFNGKPYYADLVSGWWIKSPHNEVMIFAVENDEINFDDLYCAYPLDVDEATLLGHIEMFCLENK